MTFLLNVFLSNARISTIEELSSQFCLVEIEGTDLKKKKWNPGHKIKLYVKGAGLRSYTPLSWDNEEGRAKFIVFLNGKGAGAEGVRSLKKNDLCKFKGPTASFNLLEFNGPTLFFGDETSIGLASALRAFNPESRFVFETTMNDPSEILQRANLQDALIIQKKEADTHLVEASKLLYQESKQFVQPKFIFNGKIQSIQTVRTHLKKAGLPPSQLKIKAYWSQ